MQRKEVGIKGRMVMAFRIVLEYLLGASKKGRASPQKLSTE